MSQQRGGANSVETLVSAFADVGEEIALPPGVELRSQEELTIWNQFSRARARADWRDIDLILLAKAVRLEADIRHAQIDLDAIGIMMKNDRGTPIVNPLISVIDTWQRQQLAVFRSMSLNTTPSDPRTVAAAAKTKQTATAAAADAGKSGLLATPVAQSQCH